MEAEKQIMRLILPEFNEAMAKGFLVLLSQTKD
jgi:hypothetical protein